MRLSHKYKFLYIAPPKTGSETIREVLDKYSDLGGGKPIHMNEYTSKPPYVHSKAKKLQLYFAANHWNWNDYFKFSVVRNPFARAISSFKYDQKRGKIQPGIEFKDHIKSSGRLVGPCYPFFTIDGKRCVDYICKLENFQEDFDVVCDKIGIPQQQLPHKNTTKHKHYTEYYDDETREIVAERYARDIEYFGYKFGE